MNTIKIERIKKGRPSNAYRVLIDRKDLLDHFVEALSVEQGRKLSWPEKRHAIIDGLQLRASGADSGRYAIMNCSCGSGAGCAGLEDEIEVLHENDRVVWTYRAPRLAVERPTRLFTFAFHKPQYLKEIGRIEIAPST